MIKDIKIVQIGEQSVPLLANAATPIRYKMIFGEDIMVAFNQVNNKKRDEGEILDITTRLAFVMNMQAENDKAALKNANKEAFIDWLENFGSMDFANASEEIINVYLGTTESKSKPKNAQSRPKGN